MGSFFCASLLVVLLSVCVSLISPAQSTDCSSLKLSAGKKQYTNCTELPTLNSTLHFSYNASNSSLSIAFSAAPPSSGGWIAWAVNPTGKGMAGSQTFLAFKNNTHVVVKTYNVSSYSSIVEGKLSFDVWDLEAGSSSDGKMVIYGSLKLPHGADRVNHVWQVGPGVTDGSPMKHDFSPANLAASEELKLDEKAGSDSSSPTSAPVRVPQSADNGSSDGGRIREVYVGLWMSGLVSLVGMM